MRTGKMKLKSNLQMRNLCFMNNKIESERDGMKKGINIKNVIVSLVFLIIGIGMLLFVLFVVLPAMTHNAKVCTLEVEAIVIDNKSDLKSDSDYGQSYRYNQVVEYVVEDKKIQTTIHNLTSDPVPEGTKITLWVDPENPYIYTNNRDIKPITIIVPIAIPIGIMLFGVLGLVFNLKKEK